MKQDNARPLATSLSKPEAIWRAIEELGYRADVTEILEYVRKKYGVGADSPLPPRRPPWSRSHRRPPWRSRPPRRGSKRGPPRRPASRAARRNRAGGTILNKTRHPQPQPAERLTCRDPRNSRPNRQRAKP